MRPINMANKHRHTIKIESIGNINGRIKLIATDWEKEKMNEMNDQQCFTLRKLMRMFSAGIVPVFSGFTRIYENESKCVRVCVCGDDDDDKQFDYHIHKFTQSELLKCNIMPNGAKK